MVSLVRGGVGWRIRISTREGGRARFSFPESFSLSESRLLSISISFSLFSSSGKEVQQAHLSTWAFLNSYSMIINKLPCPGYWSSSIDSSSWSIPSIFSFAYSSVLGIIYSRFHAILGLAIVKGEKHPLTDQPKPELAGLY